MTTDQTTESNETVTVEMTGSTNDEETAKAKNKEIEAALDKACEDGKRDPELFKLALELGASQELLGRCTRFVGANHERGLPWVGELVEAGHSKAWIRQLLMEYCFRDEGAADFRSAFLRDLDTWEVFETPQQLRTFFEALTEHDTDGVLRHRDALAYRIGRLKRPDLEPHCSSPLYTREANRDREAKRVQEIITVGLEDANFVAQKAVRGLWHPGHDTTLLEVVLSLPRTSRIEAAKHVTMNHRGLQLIGYVLGFDAPYDRREVDWVITRLVRKIDEQKVSAPLIYRWLLKGGDDQVGGPNRLQMSEHDSLIRHCIESTGWAFCRLETYQPPRSNRPQLQAVLPNVRPRLVWAHDSRGSSEHLKEGDEVIAPRRPLNGDRPVNDTPGLCVYRTILQPAAPPSAGLEKLGSRAFHVP